MDIRYFNYVIEISECGSINKAAKHLKISQPNLSANIKNLEQELGFPIFKRSNNGIHLTEEGELFLHSAKKIVTEMDSIRNIPLLFANKGNISISCTNSFDFMNQFLKFKRKNPAPESEDFFKETGLIQTTRDVIERRYRISLFYCFDEVADTYYSLARKHNLHMAPVAQNMPLILLTSKRNPLASKKEIEFKDIKKFRFVMYENFKFSEWLKILGFENDNKILYVFDRGGMIDVIKQSNYVTVLGKRYSKQPYSPDCVEIPIIHAPCSMNAYIMYESSYTMNSREKLFIRQLKTVFTAA